MVKLDQFNRMREAKMVVSFRVADGTVEHRAETISISPDRLIICSLIELEPNSRLAMKLQIPESNDFLGVALHGRVVCGSKLADAKFGYLVEIDSNFGTELTDERKP